jgi:hypothetical protein
MKSSTTRLLFQGFFAIHLAVLPLVWCYSAPLLSYGAYAAVLGLPVTLIVTAALLGIAFTRRERTMGMAAAVAVVAASIWAPLALYAMALVVFSILAVSLPRTRWRPLQLGVAGVVAQVLCLVMSADLDGSGASRVAVVHALFVWIPAVLTSWLVVEPA